MKGQKGEGAKQSQVKGATERGPLFPRLHVNETEKAGPKAPPRNKMALYEQFTVPSHRFVQPSQKPASKMYQQQYGMRELGYPYVPYYIPSGPNHGVSMYPQPSRNTSSSGVISGGAVNEEIRQNASRQQKLGKSSPCKVSRHLTEATADCLIKSLPAQKDKADFVPAQSSLTNQAEESANSLQNAPSDMEGPHITDITESLQDALSTVVEVDTDCIGPDVRTCELPKGRDLVNSTRGKCLTDEDKLKQADQLSIFEMLTQPTKKGSSGPLDKSTVQSCLQTESSRDVCKADCALTSHLHYTTRCGTLIKPKGLEERSTVNAHCQNSLSSENPAIMDIQSASTSSESLDTNVHKNASKHPTTELAKADFPKLGTATSEEIKLIQNRTSEASQTTQGGTCKEGHSDVSVMPSLSLDTEWVIKPKDVIRAVGQQQFWKARKKLLRQQRIFSDQVFQLHKLIKIQQLLAETPGTLMDEEMHFETEEDCDATITSAKRATASSEDAKNVAFYNNEGSKCKSSEAEDQGNKKRGQTQEDGKVGLGSNSCRLESSSVGVSAWGYPSLGPWAGPMAAQGGPFPYPPFAGAFPPGSAFGVPVGPSFPGSMMSFGIPFYDGRREPPAEMDSNYGPPGASKHEGSGTASVNSNHVSNDIAASWYFAQYNHHVNNHRSLAGGSFKDAPTGSGASVNNSFATAQAVKAPCFPGLSYQWGLNCQAGLVNTDGLGNSAHQSEHSSPTNATRVGGRTPATASKPLTKPLGFPRRDAESLVQNLDPACTHRSNSLNQFDSGKKFLEKEISVMRTSSLPNHYQEEAVCLSVNCPLTDVNSSALELFPLVPSLSSGGGRVVKAGEEGQGGVIRAVPRRAVAASKSAAGILLSLQQERQK